MRLPTGAAWIVQIPVALMVACGGARHDPRPVDDAAALLSAAAESDLAEWHAALLAQYDIDLRVMTAASMPDLGRFAADAFEERRVGARSRTGRGLLLVIDAGDERVRLEVARPLEGVFVDSFVAYLENEQMRPFFAAGRVGEGVVAAAELIAGRAERGLAAAEFDDRSTAATSAGAGAEADAPLGGGAERPSARWFADTAAAASPEDAVEAYLAAMAALEADAALDLYTPESRDLLADQVMTRAQMDNVVRTYGACPEPELLLDDPVAVLRYPPAARACAPWLLERAADGRWRLDLVAMRRAIRFDTRNHWRIADRAALGPYEFAFGD